MHSEMYIQCALIFLCLPVVLAFGTGSAETSSDGGSGTIKFGPPDLNDEMASSFFIPDKLKCDACRAIAYQMWVEFKKYNAIRKYLKYDVPESELIDLVETICIGESAWKEYGMKEINRIPRLAGPGLETMDSPGVTALGGKWPGRLRDMCESYIGEVGEPAIYKVFRDSPSKIKPLEDFLCHGDANSIRGSCTPQKRSKVKDDL